MSRRTLAVIVSAIATFGLWQPASPLHADATESGLVTGFSSFFQQHVADEDITGAAFVIASRSGIVGLGTAGYTDTTRQHAHRPGYGFSRCFGLQDLCRRADRNPDPGGPLQLGRPGRRLRTGFPHQRRQQPGPHRAPVGAEYRPDATRIRQPDRGRPAAGAHTGEVSRTQLHLPTGGLLLVSEQHFQPDRAGHREDHVAILCAPDAKRGSFDRWR